MPDAREENKVTREIKKTTYEYPLESLLYLFTSRVNGIQAPSEIRNLKHNVNFDNLQIIIILEKS